MPIYAINTIFFTLLLSYFCTSCSHYSIIRSDDNAFNSIYIHNISNQDFAPNIQVLFQNQLRETFIRDNRLKLSSEPHKADTQLYINLIDYNRYVKTRSSKNSGRFNSLNLKLKILVSLYDNRINTYLLKDVKLDSRETLFFNPTGKTLKHREMEYQLLPTISRNLSEDILNLILSDWP